MSQIKIPTIFHIYSGTSGVAGAYLNSIVTGISSGLSCYQSLYVSSYYPYADVGGININKVFYPISDLASKVRLRAGLFRFAIRYVELLIAYCIILIGVFLRRPSVVNYSLITSLSVDLQLLRCIRWLNPNCLIVVTFHDVNPFACSYSGVSKQIHLRKRIAYYADKVLVHGKKQKDELVALYSVDQAKVLEHMFPPMPPPPSSVIVGDESYCSGENSGLRFCFVGHMRMEKGVDLLLDAWRRAHLPNSLLVIAGNAPPDRKELLEKMKSINVELYFDYLEDKNYIGLLSSMDFVVLPYQRGTNSGIPTTAAYLNCLTIATDLPMFSDSPIVFKDFIFKAGCVDSLATLLNNLGRMKVENVKAYKKQLRICLGEYERLFLGSVINCYESLLN